MTRVNSAICWASVILMVALASRFGRIDEGSATTLLIVLPIAAWMALSGRGRGRCPLWRKA